MKVFISADMEGTAGIADWNEAQKDHPDYAEFRALMTAEVVAACEGARAAGAEEVVVKDAHWTARNIEVSQLPDYARIMRGWSGHPDGMMFGLDNGFAAAIYTGYHSKSGRDANPLAHTITRRIGRLKLNGEVASEFILNALCAERHRVPSVFISGDAGICAEARAIIGGIGTVETVRGFGAATLSLSPAAACTAIREGVEAALTGKAGGLPFPQENYVLEVEFTNPVDAYRASWYPGADYSSDRVIRFEADDFFEVQRALAFIV